MEKIPRHTPKPIPKAATVPSPELGYRLDSPASPTPLQIPKPWSLGKVDPVSSMVEELLQFGWRLSHLRELITTLGVTPEGQTRRQVAQQLAERFLDPERLEQGVHDLSDEEQRYYATLILQTYTQSYYTAPQGKVLWRGFSTPWPKLAQRIHKAGLALITEEEQLFLPASLRQKLPPLQIPFPKGPRPQKIISANPREILTQVQQLLGLLQSEPFELRPRLRWQAPSYPYAQPVICWPPTPADAQKLIASPDMDGSIELLPPDPDPSAGTLAAWSRALSCSEERAEFLYALLANGGIILRGSPITIDNALAQQWLALTPGTQVGMLYQLWRDATTWSEWWPLWRDQRIRVTRLYHGYWGLNSMDNSVENSVIDLRGCCSSCSLSCRTILGSLPAISWTGSSRSSQRRTRIAI